MKTKTYVCKEVEQIKGEVIKDFGLALEKLDFITLGGKKGFLGIGQKTEIQVKTKVDGDQAAINYVKQFLDNLGIESSIELTKEDKIYKLTVDAQDDNGSLIGKDARNLMAMQSLLSIIFNGYYDDHDYSITYDIGLYRKNKDKKLELLAVKLAKEVAHTKVPAKLTDLNSYERKVIHDKLSKWHDVTTASEGEEPHRVLIISPKNSK